MLLALFEPPEAIAAQILGAAGITQDSCEYLGGGRVASAEANSTDRRPLTEQAKNVLVWNEPLVTRANTGARERLDLSGARRASRSRTA
jgi:hypothetical protein